MVSPGLRSRSPARLREEDAGLATARSRRSLRRRRIKSRSPGSSAWANSRTPWLRQRRVVGSARFVCEGTCVGSLERSAREIPSRRCAATQAGSPGAAGAPESARQTAHRHPERERNPAGGGPGANRLGERRRRGGPTVTCFSPQLAVSRSSEVRREQRVGSRMERARRVTMSVPSDLGEPEAHR
jgi:hypothetical protein